MESTDKREAVLSCCDLPVLPISPPRNVIHGMSLNGGKGAKPIAKGINDMRSDGAKHAATFLCDS